MQKYTIHAAGKAFQLRNIDNNSTVEVGTEHPKHSWIAAQVGRIVTITDTRWSSSKDYHGAYEAKAPQAKAKPIKIELTKLDSLQVDASLFQPMLTSTIFDKFASSEGGFMPGSNIMAAGAPGIGKTTVLLDLLANMQAAGKKVLFISAEMNQIDMARYLQRFPNWGQLPILFLGDYTEQCPKTVIEQVLNEGWDLVLTDSYTEVNDTIKEECNLTRGKTEKWFLDLMSAHNKAQNSLKKYTTFVTILQLSKGGTFVGSNKLKHMTTSMLHLDWDGSENRGLRYMEFSKNRVGQVGKKLYFSLDGGVKFDEGRYARDLFNDELLVTERKQLEEESNAFDKLFGFGTGEAVEEVEVQETMSL